MKYLKMHAGYVQQIICDNDATFPGVPAAQRYPASYLAACIMVADDIAVSVGQQQTASGWAFPSVDEAPSQPIDPGKGITQKTYAEKLADLETENAQLTAKLEASIQSNQMLEDCLVEMAEIVYA